MVHHACKVINKQMGIHVDRQTDAFEVYIQDVFTLMKIDAYCTKPYQIALKQFTFISFTP